MRIIGLLFVLLLVIASLDAKQKIKGRKRLAGKSGPLDKFVRFLHFKLEYKKVYVNKSLQNIASTNFENNFKFIEEQKNKSLNYRLELNRFADQDCSKVPKGLQLNDGILFEIYSTKTFVHSFRTLKESKVLKYFNWADYGAVTSVQDQGDCGSSYAYAVTGTIESAYFRNSGALIKFSEQQIIDCSQPFGNHGCRKGNQFASFDYIFANNGLMPHSKYSENQSKNMSCDTIKYLKKPKLANYYKIENGLAKNLQVALFDQGPLAVSIDATPQSFVFYSGGIYDDPKCKSELKNANHAVLLVGYGYEKQELYWIIKNSWSDSWGEKGYMRISAKNNICGVMNLALFAKMQ